MPFSKEDSTLTLLLGSSVFQWQDHLEQHIQTSDQFHFIQQIDIPEQEQKHEALILSQRLSEFRGISCSVSFKYKILLFSYFFLLLFMFLLLLKESL